MDAGLREPGARAPGRSEPTVPPLAIVPPAGAAEVPPPVIYAPPPPSVPARSVFAGDRPEGAEAFGFEAPLTHLAELVAHRGTAPPLCIGVLGGAGSGKSFALCRLTSRLGEITRSAASVKGPFLSRIHVQAIDAASLRGDPMSALAAQIHAGLRQPYPELAREVTHTTRDPHVVAREASEKLDESRRRLDAERCTLEESGSRRARLTETVLYESAGSPVDSYARANRGRLESRLAAFGMPGDTIHNYKNLVRVVAEGGSPLGFSLRALYAFKGQTRLLVLAVLFLLAGIGLGMAVEMQDSWLGALRSAGPQAAGSAADWIEAHMGLLGPARKAAFALAILMIGVNLWRAFGFVQPILTGVRLLKVDLTNRRRDLDGLYAHHTKRVDGLTADVERLARVSAEAEQRLGDVPAHSGGADLPLLEPTAEAQAQEVVAALGRSLRGSVADGMPQRIVLAVDDLDAVSPERTREVFETLHRIATMAGLVIIVAFDPQRARATRADLERWVQVPLRLDVGPLAGAALVQHALGRAAPAVPVPVEPTRSALDEPVGEEEAALLAALASLAGSSPRAVKRFVNLYTVARLDSAAPRGALALMLALDGGGSQAERQVAEDAMKSDDGAVSFDPRPTTARLRVALDAVRALDGPLSKVDVAAASARAAMFSVSAFE